MSQKRALIAGFTGQDGSYLAELLLNKGYQVIGLTRDVSTRFTPNTSHLKGKVELHYCPYTEISIIEAVRKYQPDEIYNFAAQTYVSKSWEMIPETIQNTALIPTYFLEAIVKENKKIKFFQASSSEIFTPSSSHPLTEDSPLNPSNPYGCSKAFAHQMVAMFRRYHGLYAVSGILFNHESPRRGSDFLSKKLVRAAVNIKRGQQKELSLGNLTAARDWGYAPDFVKAIDAMMHLREPCDLMICTGRLHSVEDMVRIVFQQVGLSWKDHVKNDPALHRPFETPSVLGSNRKIQEITGWVPKTSFEEMVKIMVDEEIRQQDQGEC